MKKSIKKRIVCKACSGNDIFLRNGLFVCQSCGCEYTHDELENLLTEIDEDGINGDDSCVCPYCGGELTGEEKTCPHCFATVIEVKDYLTDTSNAVSSKINGKQISAKRCFVLFVIVALVLFFSVLIYKKVLSFIY